MAYNFPRGFCIELQGQRYEPTGDGPQPNTIAWSTNCPECGRKFLLWTTLTFRMPTRRCSDCKSPGKRVRHP